MNNERRVRQLEVATSEAAMIHHALAVSAAQGVPYTVALTHVRTIEAAWLAVPPVMLADGRLDVEPSVRAAAEALGWRAPEIDDEVGRVLAELAGDPEAAGQIVLREETAQGGRLAAARAVAAAEDILRRDS